MGVVREPLMLQAGGILRSITLRLFRPVGVCLRLSPPFNFRPVGVCLRLFPLYNFRPVEATFSLFILRMATTVFLRP